MAKFLKVNGYDVIINDCNRTAARRLARILHVRNVDDQTSAIRDAQLVVLATPTSVTRALLGSLHVDTCRDRLFIEISSVKQSLRSALRDVEKRGIFVFSIHPMFGPGTTDPNGRTILVIPQTRKMALADNFLTALRRRGARIVKCSFEEHDKLIAAVLTLPHFLTVAFVEALRSLDVNLDLLSKVAGPTFRLQLLLAEELHQESAENEASVLMDNNESVALLREYSRISKRMLNTIARGKRTAVRGKLLEGRRFLSSEKQFSTAYTRFNQAVAASGFK